MAYYLDEDQKKAVTHINGPLLVLAGAGAGKTATITERTARMIEQGVSPQNILQLTFSRKAAREMYARLYDRLGQPSQKRMPQIDTFHGFGWRLICEDPEGFGLQEGVGLLSEADQMRLLRELVRKLEITQSKLLTLSNRIANDGLSAREDQDVPSIVRILKDEGIRNFIQDLLEVFREYERRKLENNVVDFGDLIVYPFLRCRRDAAWAESLSKQFAYITVDEAQDTNRAQYVLLRSFRHTNIAMVGDDDQCIYEWRGAHPENLKNFVEDYQPTIVRLERNYRSTPAIVDMGARLIAHNTMRLEKTPWSPRQHRGEEPLLRCLADGEAMAEAIAQDIRMRMDMGEPPNKMAVLYRNNRMASILEPALQSYGIPYHVTEGVDFFERQEIQMLMAAVRAARNPYDELALVRLSELLPGVGEKTLLKMFEEARCRDLPLLEGRNYLKEGKAKESLNDLARKLEILRLWTPMRLSEWALAQEAGNFAPWLKSLVRGADNPREALNRRLMSLMAFDKAIVARLRNKGIDPRSKEAWQEVLSLGAPDEETDQGGVLLSTIFKVKGMEFRHVFVAGFSEGIMPMMRTDENGNEVPARLEEERRLAYVALTRGMQTVTFYHAHQIDWGYYVEQYNVSRFSKEMGITIQNEAKPIVEEVREGWWARESWIGLSPSSFLKG